MAMALSKQEGKKICNWFVAMPLPKQGGKKNGIGKSRMEFGNTIATIPFHFFFPFFLRNDKCTQFLQYFHNKF